MFVDILLIIIINNNNFIYLAACVISTATICSCIKSFKLLILVSFHLMF